VTLIVAVGLSVVLSACGSTSGHARGSSSPAKPTTSPIAPLTPTTLDPTVTAVVAAYRASWSAFEHALADANPSDPALAATMVDPQLQGVKANLVADQRQGIVGRGTFTLHPKITALSTASASIVDCAYSTAELVYESTGKPVPPVTPPENDGVSSTLTLTAGTWKVERQTVTDGKCAPGS
jgi:hypothetical protein